MIQDGEYLTAPQKPLKIIGEREACQVCNSYICNLCIVVITENVMCVLSRHDIVDVMYSLHNAASETDGC